MTADELAANQGQSEPWRRVAVAEAATGKRGDWVFAANSQQVHEAGCKLQPRF